MVKRLFFLSVFLPCFVFGQNTTVTDSLLQLIHTASTDTARISLYTTLASTPKLQKKQALAYADSAIRLGSETEFPAYKALALKVKGDIFYRKSDNDSSLHYESDALKIYTQSNNNVGMAMCEYGIGNVLSAMDRYPEALQAYIECEKNAEQANSQRYIAYAKNGIGTINFEMKNYSESERYHREALELAKKVNDNKLLGWTYANLGNALIQQQKYDAAIEQFQLAHDAYAKTNFLAGVAGAFNNIGVCYSYLKQYDEAIVNYNKAAEIKIQTGDIGGQSTAYGNISELYSLKGDYTNALEFAKKALALAQQGQSLLNIAQCFHIMADAYAGTKTYDSAYKYSILFKQFTDSIYNQSMQDQMTEMQAKYDHDKLEQKNSMLEKDNKIGQLYIYGYAALICLVLILALFVYSRYRSKNKANKLLEEQNEQITHQKKEITDSINYAKRIQQSILPAPSSFLNLFPESFILYRPKDIVSGDFYWAEKIISESNDGAEFILLAAVDCTGHGVPGAMMSVLGYNLLTEAVIDKKLHHPSAILSSLNSGIIRALQRQTDGQNVKDGMDVALCAFYPREMKIEFSGVINPLYIVRDGELKIYSADRKMLGADEQNNSFTSHSIDLKKGDCVYIFTDGYADQFGGPYQKKFKYKQLQEVLKKNASLPMKEQQHQLENTLDNWQGNLEQVDDILLIGFRV